jgi:hypothetical protein
MFAYVYCWSLLSCLIQFIFQFISCDLDLDLDLFSFQNFWPDSMFKSITSSDITVRAKNVFFYLFKC